MLLRSLTTKQPLTGEFHVRIKTKQKREAWSGCSWFGISRRRGRFAPGSSRYLLRSLRCRVVTDARCLVSAISFSARTFDNSTLQSGPCPAGCAIDSDRRELSSFREKQLLEPFGPSP